MNDDDDHSLVAQAQQGRRDAFDLLVLRHQETIARQMRRFSTDPNVMEELTQTVFVKAYLNLGNYSAGAPFQHWLRVIASRTGYEHWRKKYRDKNKIPYEEDRHGAVNEPELQPDEPWKNDAALILEHVMQKLRPDERQALYMLHIDDMSVQDVAETMGWNQAMTKMRAYRARKKLRKILEAEGIGPGWGD